jgi:endonuclease/exonuclease/phosphatase family metal-dependent hydrolase
VRQCQAVQVARLAAAQSAADGRPALVTGDFNEPPGSFVYRQFTERGWPDVYLAAGNPECEPSSGIGCTSGRADEELTQLESPLRNENERIDFIFLVPPGPTSSCAAVLDGPSDADTDGTATRLFADAPNPFAAACGAAPQSICWPSDHEGVEVDVECAP